MLNLNFVELIYHILIFSCHSKHAKTCHLSSEPQTGFRIAFNMFDTDGNQRVDKEEFLVVGLDCVLLPPVSTHTVVQGTRVSVQH